MDFDVSNVYSAVNAEKAPDCYGYFSNTMGALRQSVDRQRINLNTVYTRLEGVFEEKFERRFCTSQGNFALFYPVDGTFTRGRY